MSAVGIIAEFNPLHSGHKAVIDAASKDGSTVISVISGNFVQRGDTAIIPKTKRAEAALKCGVDLVAELPVCWSMSTAQNFALGGVSQLIGLGCDEILFGSESDDIELLTETADILASPDFSVLLAEELKKGITFAKAREKAAEKLGADADILSNPNDNLGIEYILAAKKLGSSIGFRTIKRIGAPHDSDELYEGAVSASLLRTKIKEGNFGFAEKYMPPEIRGLLQKDVISDINKIENAILCTLRQLTKEDLKKIPDLSEGLENKIFFSSRVAVSLEELYNMIKSKRYTLARIRRLVLSAFLGIDNSFFLKAPPYVRVLGLSDKGAEHLSVIKASLPIITKSTQIKELDSDCQKVFETESRATDLYALSLGNPQPSGAEFTSKFLKKECLF